MKHPLRSEADLDALRFNEQGLVPVIAQDQITGAVLMLAWADKDALAASLHTGAMTYWSRSRQRAWTKGEESGHTQSVVSLAADCDRDAVLATVGQTGPACHEGTGTCWSQDAEEPLAGWLGHLDAVAAERLAEPQGRYTDSLLADPALAAAKVVEEAQEVAAVLRGEDNEDTLEHELADLLYHAVVAARAGGISLQAALRELAGRA